MMMQDNPQNETSQAPVVPLSIPDERTWAMLAHLTVLINLVTGFIGPIIALLIYLILKDRSRYVAYHALQSFMMQIIWWIGGGFLAGILWAVSGVLTVVCVGVLLYPLAIIASLLPVAAIIFGIVGAVQTSQGQDFRYWLIGDWLRGTLNGQ